MLALPWLVLDLTGSPVQTAIAMTMDFLPQLMFGFFAGAVIDRVNRKYLMIVCDLLRAALLFCLPVLAWGGTLSVGHVFAVGFLLSTLTTFFDPTQNSVVPRIVAREALVEANSKLQLANTATRVIGPVLAGVIIGWMGATGAIILDGVSFVVSAALIMLLASAAGRSGGHRPEKGSIFRDIREGLSYLVRERVVFAITLLMCFVNLGIGPVLAQRTFFAREVIGLNSRATGLIYSVGGVGALLGSLAAGPLGRKLGRVTALVGGTAVLGLAAAGMGLATGFYSLAAVEFAILFTTIVANIHSTSLIQELTPAHLLGRVLSSSNVLGGMILPAAMSASGPLVVVVGVRGVLVVGGAAIVAASIIGWVSALRRAGARKASTA